MSPKIVKMINVYRVLRARLFGDNLMPHVRRTHIPMKLVFRNYGNMSEELSAFLTKWVENDNPGRLHLVKSWGPAPKEEEGPQ